VLSPCEWHGRIVLGEFPPRSSQGSAAAAVSEAAFHKRFPFSFHRAYRSPFIVSHFKFLFCPNLPLSAIRRRASGPSKGLTEPIFPYDFLFSNTAGVVPSSPSCAFFFISLFLPFDRATDRNKRSQNGVWNCSPFPCPPTHFLAIFVKDGVFFLAGLSLLLAFGRHQ